MFNYLSFFQVNILKTTFHNTCCNLDCKATHPSDNNGCFVISSFFTFSDEEALKLIEKDSTKTGGRKKSGSNWQEKDMGSILCPNSRCTAFGPNTCKEAQ